MLNQNLSEEKRLKLVKTTKTDYVTIERIENNILMTEYYQNSEDVDLFHIDRDKIKKPWYKFWK